MSSVVVERNVMVRMRDGLHLATDIYRPVDEDGRQLRPLPVILERTPYDKSGISRSEVTAEDPNPVSRVVLAEFFARHGFVVAVQDCRGRTARKVSFKSMSRKPKMATTRLSGCSSSHGATAESA